MSIEMTWDIRPSDEEYFEAETTRCECGEITGVRCEWTGSPAETVVVEWMPEWIRESHRAAGGSGGEYPHDGSERLRLAAECATRCAEDDEWCEILAR